MSWTNVKLIYCRELRDQLRDRRTLFMIAVLPLVLYPLLGITLSPIVAAAAMSLSSLSVVSNALRLRATRI